MNGGHCCFLLIIMEILEMVLARGKDYNIYYFIILNKTNIPYLYIFTFKMSFQCQHMND